MTDPALGLRPATEADCERLLAWANDPDARASAIRCTAQIAFATHRAWFTARLADPCCRIWIIEHDGHPIGQVRLEGDRAAREVSIFVERGFRRAGIARAAIKQALAAFGGEAAVARVRNHNIASRRLFESLGFAIAASHSHVVVYRGSISDVPL
ncbi:MAG: GNAT family N-acetyltransferase [Alphaproteobacteria bacterium]|nr:GNAT family N-acetyltransferase [Alphaproteobacteria bacterium]